MSYNQLMDNIQRSNFQSIYSHMNLFHFLWLYNHEDYFPFVTLSMNKMRYYSLAQFLKFGDTIRDLSLLPYAYKAATQQLELRSAYTKDFDAKSNNIEVITKRSVAKLSNASIVWFARFLTGQHKHYNTPLRKRKLKNPRYPHYFWNHLKRRMMKMIEEYKSIRIGNAFANEKKKQLEFELVELFHLWWLNGKGLKYIEEDVKYICRKKMKRIQMSMDDVDSDMEETLTPDIKLIIKSRDTQEANLIKLTKIAFILSSPDIIDIHAFHWSVLEEEVEELIQYAEWADTLASLMTSFLKVCKQDIKGEQLIRKLYQRFENEFYHELAEINPNIALRLATQILKNVQVIGKENTENIIEFLGYFLLTDSFNLESNDREFEEFWIALIQYMPGTGGRKQFRVAANTKSFTVFSMMVQSIISRVNAGEMNYKSLVKIIYHSCRYSFDFNVNYVVEPDVIREYFLSNIKNMDLYDMHVLWLALWDWPECFKNDAALQQLLIEKTFLSTIENENENKFSELFSPVLN